MDKAPKQFKCTGCAADMDFTPGTSSLTCPYCGNENHIPQSEEDIRELDFNAYLAQVEDEDDFVDRRSVKCNSCGASTTLDPNVISDQCAFCGSDLITSGDEHRIIKPKSLLPFSVTEDEAKTLFKAWIKGLWFAPNELKKYAVGQTKINGIYIPYWTYDASTMTWYSGERGEYYYVTEHYTVKVGKRTEQRTRRVRKTRWYSASGTVWNSFNDILVLASHSLPVNYVEKLEPWDLESLVPYRDEYLSGFRAESYQVDLEDGFDEAKERMVDPIRDTIRDDIGGDCQRIHRMATQHNNVTFKHILLPIWISAYRYNQKSYRFLVNARTGEVQGERPWSWVKITLLVLVIAAIIAVMMIVASAKSSPPDLGPPGFSCVQDKHQIA